MSIEALAIALYHSRARTPIQKLVLIGIANHDGDGGSWPAVAKLARYASCSPRAVQVAIDELERFGEVRKHRQQGGDRWTADYLRPNLYEFLLTCPPDCDGTKNHRTRRQSSVSVDLDDLHVPDGYPPVDKPPAPRAPGAAPAGDPLHEVHPNQSSQPSSSDPELEADPPRTRETWSHVCIDGRMDTHRLSPSTRACAFCAATKIRYQEPS